MPRSAHRYQLNRLATVIAPVAPAIMLFIGVATGLTGLSHLLFSDRTNDIAATLLACAVGSIVLAVATRIAARRELVDVTGVLGSCFVGLFSATVNLVAWLSGQGIAQSLPYSVIAALGAALFWPRVRYFLLGMIASMAPPLVLLVFATHKTSTVFLAIQLMAYGTIAALALYLLLRESTLQVFEATYGLHYRATYDGLTELLNRNAWLEQAEAQLGLDRANDHPSSILFLDVDQFKQINDDLGHSAGDQLLQAVAKVVRETIADRHFAGRIGGDEFVVFLTQTGEDEAASLVQRLRLHLAQQDVALSVSIGIAECDRGESLALAMQRADRTMLAAKLARRNGIRSAAAR